MKKSNPTSRWMRCVGITTLVLSCLPLVVANAQAQARKPNILIIWGDDIGVHNISASNHGGMGYGTPNIDRLAKEGALFTDAYADPCEKGPNEADLGYLRWYGDNLWTFVPAQEYIKKFLATIPEYPFQEGSSLNAAGINYQTLKAAGALKRLQELDTLSPPR